MHDEVVTDVKSLLGRVDALESRLEGIQVKGVSVIRHVRDVDYWGLPYGTVIVARGKGKGKALTSIWKPLSAVSDDAKRNDGFSKYQGSNDSIVYGSKKPAFYYVGKQGGKFAILDENGKNIHSASSEIDALEWLNDYAAKRSKDRYKKPYTKERGQRPVPTGMHKPTGAELQAYKGINNLLVDVFVYDDPSKHDTYGYGYDRRDKQSTFRKNETVQRKKANKFAILKSMQKKMPSFEKDLEKNWKTSDTAKALYFMRMFGLRVGSTGEQESAADEKAFGATQMLFEHVKFSRGKATIKLPSKKGALADFDIEDPTAIDILKDAVKGKKRGDRLFFTDSGKTSAYLQRVFGAGVINHNLRHYRATEEAIETLEDWMKDYELPTTYEEFVNDWAKPLGLHVEETILFDKEGQGWKSYIDPYVLSVIAKNNPEWVEDFATKYSDKGV